MLILLSKPDMNTLEQKDFVSLDPKEPFWERVYMVSPLVVIGTRDAGEDTYNLAPKHMAMPMGWKDFFGFVCTPRHKTYHNAVQTGVFTVSYPKPSQVVLASLTASPRADKKDGLKQKPIIDKIPRVGAETIDGIFLADAYLLLECELDRKDDDLGENSLLIGKVRAFHVQESALRVSEEETGEKILENPLLAYLPPDKYATIDETNAFPFPKGFKQ